MAGVIESIKNFYSGKNAIKTNLILFVISFIYMTASSLFDIAIGKGDTMQQNLFDIAFGIFIAVYSIQYIHNALYNINPGKLPELKEIDPKIILPLIGINIIWAVYFIVALIIAFSLFYLFKSSVIAIILGILILAVTPFFQFIYIGFADKYEQKCLLNLALIFKFAKASFVPLWIAVLKVTFLSIIVIALYLGLYFAGEYFGFAELLPISKDYYAFDAVIVPVFMYILAVIWYFIFPYLLLNTYKEKIRPILGYECEEQAIVIEGESA